MRVTRSLPLAVLTWDYNRVEITTFNSNSAVPDLVGVGSLLIASFIMSPGQTGVDPARSHAILTARRDEPA
jgi:hypothetical protein